MHIIDIYQTLLSHFGEQGWWPMQRGFSPKGWEVCLGAVLTQNTNWRNVEKALANLKNSGILGYGDILKTDIHKLARLIKPSGYYNQKAKKLHELAGLVSRYKNISEFLRTIQRDELLGVKGIGKETADSILLYAGSRAHFVVDAYTKRIFSRLGLLSSEADYDEIKCYFENNLPRDVLLYKEFHALIVRLGKDVCRKKPICDLCPLSDICDHDTF